MAYIITVTDDMEMPPITAPKKRTRVVTEYRNATAVFVGEAACLIGTRAQNDGLSEQAVGRMLGDLRDQVWEWGNDNGQDSLSYFPSPVPGSAYVTIERY